MEVLIEGRINAIFRVDDYYRAGDAFLAVDRNRNARIDDRSELFGGDVGEGFAQLAAFDSNKDGVVDRRDRGFHQLRVWRDANGNHQTDLGELQTLLEVGIASIDVRYTTLPEVQNGNLLQERSAVILTDGRKLDVIDVYFRVGEEQGERDEAPSSSSTAPLEQAENRVASTATVAGHECAWAWLFRAGGGRAAG